MFVRVSTFGHTHRELFPESSPAGQAFAAVAGAAEQYAVHANARRMAEHSSRRAKADARKGINERIRSIARTARLVSSGTVGGSNQFPLPADPSDAAMLVTARAFIRDAQAALKQFVALGLSVTIIKELEALVESFEAADRARKAGAAERKTSTEGMRTALHAGFVSLRTLDVAVPNAAKQNPVVLDAWRRARRVPRRGKTDPVVPPTPTPAPIPQTPGSAAA